VDLLHSAPSRKPGFPRARVVFAAGYLALQAALVLTAARRPEHAFGFQMFSESCVARLVLLREIDAPTGHGTIVVPAPRGEWAAADLDGDKHHFEWRDRVKAPSLATFDVFFEASYGAAAELSRVQAALDDAIVHLDGDAETRRLFVDVTLKRNGREPSTVRLASAERALARRP
jgi:hypothetical protein